MLEIFDHVMKFFATTFRFWGDVWIHRGSLFIGNTPINYFGEKLMIREDQNSNTTAVIRNDHAGTGAFAELAVAGAIGALHFYRFGSGWTTNGAYIQNSALIEADDPLDLAVNVATGKKFEIKVNTVTKLTVDSNGVIAKQTPTAITASAPPTQAEMVSALGSASSQSGVRRIVSVTSGAIYEVFSNGTSWYYSAYTVGA